MAGLWTAGQDEVSTSNRGAPEGGCMWRLAGQGGTWIAHKGCKGPQQGGVMHQHMATRLEKQPDSQPHTRETLRLKRKTFCSGAESLQLGGSAQSLGSMQGNSSGGLPNTYQPQMLYFLPVFPYTL